MAFRLGKWTTELGYLERLSIFVQIQLFSSVNSSSETAISSSIWYLYGVLNFNPLDLGKQKNIPAEDMFWNH